MLKAELGRSLLEQLNEEVSRVVTDSSLCAARGRQALISHTRFLEERTNRSSLSESFLLFKASSGPPEILESAVFPPEPVRYTVVCGAVGDAGHQVPGGNLLGRA